MSAQDREDSGVIDLFAICQRASATPARDLTPPDLFSVAPPAFSVDVSDDDDSGLLVNPFAKKPRKKLALIALGAALFVGVIAFVSISAGGASPAKASASGRAEPATQVVPAPPPAAVQPPPPVVAAIPVRLPPPPTTGAPAAEKAPPRPQSSILTKPRAPATNGPKMTKVQSGGVPSK